MRVFSYLYYFSTLRVAICHLDSLQILNLRLSLFFFFLLCAGGYLSLDPTYPAQRLAIYVEDAGASIILTQSHLVKSATELAAGRARVVAVDTLDVSGHPGTDLPPTRCDSETTFLILFTSGSTGRPKGVQHAHRHVRDLLLGMRDYYRIGKHFLSIVVFILLYFPSLLRFTFSLASTVSFIASPTLLQVLRM